MTARSELLERDAEAALLGKLADRAPRRQRGCVVVAGIGKTALLGRIDELAAGADPDEVRISGPRGDSPAPDDMRCWGACPVASPVRTSWAANASSRT